MSTAIIDNDVIIIFYTCRKHGLPTWAVNTGVQMTLLFTGRVDGSWPVNMGSVYRAMSVLNVLGGVLPK